MQGDTNTTNVPTVISSAATSPVASPTTTATPEIRTVLSTPNSSVLRPTSEATTPDHLATEAPTLPIDDDESMHSVNVLYLPSPPNVYTAFWDWIHTHFPHYYTIELFTTITRTLGGCSSLEQLQRLISTWSPASIIGFMGDKAYDSQRISLIDFTILYNFVVKSFWSDHDGDTLITVPMSSWFSYRERAHMPVTIAFPTSTEHYASLPPKFAHISPAVRTEMSERRSTRSKRSKRSTGSYHTTSPNLPTSPAGNTYPHGHPDNPVDKDYEPTDSECYGHIDPNDCYQPPGTDGSRRSRTGSEPWNKPMKVRNKVSDKINWNGTRATFRMFRKAIEGHLLQVNAGYLIDPQFLDKYYSQYRKGLCVEYLESEPFWNDYEVPYEQARSDRQYLYGILVSTCHATDNKVILEHAQGQDGILAWIRMLGSYAHGGSITQRLEDLDDLLRVPYVDNSPGGLTEYVEQFQALMAEVHILKPLRYTDEDKAFLLTKNVRRAPGVGYLAQRCRDDRMTYHDTSDYLADNALQYDRDNAIHNHKRVMLATGDTEHTEPSDRMLTFTEVHALFKQTAEETNIFMAYNSFNSRTIRQSLRIADDLWHALEPGIKDKINELRVTIKEARAAKEALALKKPSSDGATGIPAQYPNMKANNMVTDPTDQHVNAMNVLCDTIGSSMNFDDDYDTDDEEFHMQMVQHALDPDDDNAEVPITVHANFEYTTTGRKNYAISDSGADSCCLGKHCHPVSYTGRHAVLVGYNPESTRSGKVPIITGYLKVMSSANVPIILCVHEAPYLADSEVTLISEYQSREHGIAIDSVAQRHKTVGGTFGTQRMVVSADLHVPYEDRGGLLGFEILPWDHGDERIYEIFDITRDEPWKPRRFRDIESHETNLNLETTVSAYNVLDPADDVIGVYDYMLPIAPAEPELYYFDPADAKLTTLGHAATVSIAKEYPQDTPADDLLSYLSYRELTGYEPYDGFYDGYPDTERQELSVTTTRAPNVPSVLDLGEDTFDTSVYAVASWHRVLHDNLHPKQLQPYLGWAPLRVIQKTLDVTTQLAKMVIRYPMRRHIRSRMSFMRAQRLNEVVSTDPMFANCKCFGPGWSGGQVFYGLKSTKIDIIGFKGKGEFPRCYRDYIRTCGVPSGLRRDNAKEEQSAEVDAIHRELYIKDEFSEPYNQQQNPVESRAIRYLKEHVHVLLDRTGAPDAAWYHAAKYLCEIHSILSNKHLPDSITPQQYRTGVTTDISPWLQFQFYQAILYLDNENSWPSSKERSGYWLGISENIGDFLTYWILDDQTKQVLARSVVRPFNRNKRVQWDPIIASKPVRETAHNGGEIKPTAGDIRQKMNNIEDKFDKQEPEPEPHYFDPEEVDRSITGETKPDNCEETGETKPKDGETRATLEMGEQNTKRPPALKYMEPMMLDTSLDAFVPCEPDQYKGSNRLRFSRDEIGIDPEIPQFPRRAKKPYNDIRYKHHHSPEEQPHEVMTTPGKPKAQKPEPEPPICYLVSVEIIRQV